MIKDEKGTPLNGFLLLKLPPPSPLPIDLQDEFYPYFHNLSKAIDNNGDYDGGYVLKTYYVANGRIHIKANDIQDFKDDKLIEHLAYDETRFWFFYPYASSAGEPMFPSGKEFDIPEAPDDGDVTWWTMNYRSSDSGPLVQNVTMVFKDKNGDQLFDWTQRTLLKCDYGSCYTPNHEDRQNYVLEAPSLNMEIYNGSEAPVLLIHGINGQSGYWEDNETRLREKKGTENTWEFYYRGTEDIPHSTYLLKLGVEELYKKYNKKVALITHSYGGVITRKYCIDYKADAEIKISKIMMIAPPHHGSISSKRVYERDTLVLNQRLWFCQQWTLDPMAPIYRDLTPGSENLMTMVGESFPKGVSTIVIAGTNPYVLLDIAHDEAPNHDDGPVSISSASLLPVGVPLGFVDLDHKDQPIHEDITTLINQFVNNSIPIGKEEVLKYLIEDSFPRTELSGMKSYNEAYPKTLISNSPKLERGGIIVDCRGNPNITEVKIIKPFFLDKKLEKNNSIFYYYDDFNLDRLIIDDGFAYPIGDEFSEIITLKFFSGDMEIETVNFPIYPCSTNVWPIKGDVNGDNVIDLSDAVLTMRVITGQYNGDGINLWADVNGDKKISIAEFYYIVKALSRL